MLRPSILLDGRVWILRVIFNMISQGPRLCVLLLMPDSMSMVASPNLYGFGRLLGRAVGKQPQALLEKLPNCWVCCWNQVYRKLMAKRMLNISWIECNLWTNPEKKQQKQNNGKIHQNGKKCLTPTLFGPSSSYVGWGKSLWVDWVACHRGVEKNRRIEFRGFLFKKCSVKLEWDRVVISWNNNNNNTSYCYCTYYYYYYFYSPGHGSSISWCYPFGTAACGACGADHAIATGFMLSCFAWLETKGGHNVKGWNGTPLKITMEPWFNDGTWKSLAWKGTASEPNLKFGLQNVKFQGCTSLSVPPINNNINGFVGRVFFGGDQWFLEQSISKVLNVLCIVVSEEIWVEGACFFPRMFFYCLELYCIDTWFKNVQKIVVCRQCIFQVFHTHNCNVHFWKSTFWSRCLDTDEPKK